MIKIIRLIYRLLKYKAEWSKQFREIKVKRVQNELISKTNPLAEKIILFFIPGADYKSGKEHITGGLISIISLAQETKALFGNSETLTLCSNFYDQHLLFKLTSFENSTEVLNPKIIENYFSNVKELILHIPELYVSQFVENQLNNSWINQIDLVQINILNQNINLMPETDIVNTLKAKYSNTTITTAHKKYCTAFYQKKYGIPYHQLSVWISPENYMKTEFDKKENLILFSPDNYELSNQLILKYSELLKQFKFQIIQSLSYEEYKKRIATAKYLITTGEGLDAYFIESYFSGSVAFACRNKDFFDEKYWDLPCLFDVNEQLETQLLKLIKAYDNEIDYRKLNEQVCNLLEEDYSYLNYKNNLQKFYDREYSYA